MKKLLAGLLFITLAAFVIGCGTTDGSGSGVTPTIAATPTAAELTSAEQVSLDFVAGHVNDLDSLFRKEMLVIEALSAGDIASATVYIDATGKLAKKVGDAYQAFPAAGGRVEEIETLWDAAATDLQKMADGIGDMADGGSADKANAAATKYKADVKMLKAELDGLGVTY